MINNCASNPCNNGAKCTSLKDDYTCLCKPGFKGRDCEIEVIECLSNPCHENAVCVDKASFIDFSLCYHSSYKTMSFNAFKPKLNNANSCRSLNL